MTKANEIYKCGVCGNTVSIIWAGGGTLVCCGKNMNLLNVQGSVQEGKEKHVPVIEIKGERVVVKVGSIPHPMEEKHYIQLIQFIQSGMVIAEKHLYPGERPEAEFCLKNLKNMKDLKARELCNLHGLWSN